MSSSLRICLVSPFPPPYGGIAHWTAMVARYAVGRSDAVIDVINTAPTWRGIHNNGILLRSLGGGIQLARDVCRLIKALIGERFDVIHLTTSGHLAAVRDLVVSYVAALFGVPFVYHIRFGRIPKISESNSLEWRVIKRVMVRANSVVAIDRATRDAINKSAPHVDVCLIPNCVNLAELPVPQAAVDGVKCALFVGWVVPTKGVGELIDSWSELKPEGWRLDIVGPVEDAYKTQLQARCGLDSVRFLGSLSHEDAMDRMAKCDLFVLPSYTEGFPNAVVEAMALGKPVVSTKVGAIPEMLEGDAGILVESRNAEQLSDALNRLIDSPVLRERLGQRASDRVISRYTISVVFDAYVSLWNRVSSRFVK